MTQKNQQPQQEAAERAAPMDVVLDAFPPTHVMAREHYERLAREAAEDARE